MTRLHPRTRARLVAFILLCVVGPALAEGKPPLKGDPVRGKAVFTKNCMLCHFADGSGGKKLLPSGNPSRDFRDPAFWASRTDDQIRATINAGVPKSGMPTWKGVLKPKEIEDAMTYIKLFARKNDAKPAAAPEAAKH